MNAPSQTVTMHHGQRSACTIRCGVFTNHITITEEQVIDRLSKLADGNILDTVYRRSLIRIFVNNIYIYDDKITITFKTGDEEVEITKEILDKIEQGLGDETLCFSEATVHHEKEDIQKDVLFFIMI